MAIFALFLCAILVKSISHRLVVTRWTPSGEWMLDTILCTFVFGDTFLSGESNLISNLLKMF